MTSDVSNQSGDARSKKNGNLDPFISLCVLLTKSVKFVYNAWVLFIQQYVPSPKWLVRFRLNVVLVVCIKRRAISFWAVPLPFAWSTNRNSCTTSQAVETTLVIWTRAETYATNCSGLHVFSWCGVYGFTRLVGADVCYLRWRASSGTKTMYFLFVAKCLM